MGPTFMPVRCVFFLKTIYELLGSWAHHCISTRGCLPVLDLGIKVSKGSTLSVSRSVFPVEFLTKICVADLQRRSAAAINCVNWYTDNSPSRQSFSPWVVLFSQKELKGMLFRIQVMKEYETRTARGIWHLFRALKKTV